MADSDGEGFKNGSEWGALNGHQQAFFNLCALYLKYRKWIAAPVTATASVMSVAVIAAGVRSPALTMLLGIIGAYALLMVVAELTISLGLRIFQAGWTH